ncbi:MAG: AI-2E family transporter [Victivallales bacterium]
MKNFFERHWERMVLWAILIGLFYLLKPFFLLIFETFLITYIARTVVLWMVRKLNINYRHATILFFLMFIGAVIGVGAWIGPRLVSESNRILSDFTDDSREETNGKINRFAEAVVKNIVGEKKGMAVIGSEEYAVLLEGLKNETGKTIKTAMPHVLDSIIMIVKLCWKITVSLLIAIIFSFMLVMDWHKIARKMNQLEKSRIRTFYLDAAPHLQAFASILGKALQAQAIIAVCNTVLTAIGLWYFEVPNIALLSTIVLICGFIPILGTFLSSIPILIFAVQAGGLALVIKLIMFVAAVHGFEAYVLNPRITGEALRAHPLLILVLLLIGERFFGIWGMIVGVPIGFYVISVLVTKDENIQHEPPDRTATA